MRGNRHDQGTLGGIQYTESLTMARAHPYRFFLAGVLISVVALAQHHSHFAPAGIRTMVSLSPWNRTPHCQLITVPVRLTNYVGRADVYISMSSPHRPAADTKEHWDEYRSDILQIHDNKAEGIKEVGIVEVKYSRDTASPPAKSCSTTSGGCFF